MTLRSKKFTIIHISYNFLEIFTLVSRNLKYPQRLIDRKFRYSSYS